MTPKTQIKSFGDGDAACRRAGEYLEETYNAFLKTYKRKPDLELFIAGRFLVGKQTRTFYSVEAYGSADEAALFAAL